MEILRNKSKHVNFEKYIELMLMIENDKQALEKFWVTLQKDEVKLSPDKEFVKNAKKNLYECVNGNDLVKQ